MDLIDPAQFPELRLLLWNRDATRPIGRDEAFELYERNWRHVAVDQLTLAESTLIEELKEEFGSGHMLTGPR
ncbi:hypothetical protein [Devosia riboflavina]|nr:hypothetical protein [Devosia riboflavina]